MLLLMCTWNGTRHVTYTIMYNFIDNIDRVVMCSRFRCFQCIPPWSMATSTSTVPGCMVESISRVTRLGALAPGMSTAPTIKSCVLDEFADIVFVAEHGGDILQAWHPQDSEASVKADVEQRYLRTKASCHFSGLGSDNAATQDKNFSRWHPGNSPNKIPFSLWLFKILWFFLEWPYDPPLRIIGISKGRQVIRKFYSFVSETLPALNHGHCQWLVRGEMEISKRSWSAGWACIRLRWVLFDLIIISAIEYISSIVWSDLAPAFT